MLTTTEGAADLTRSRLLRVFFDWSHRWPLWKSGTDKYAMEPSDYGFSLELVLRDAALAQILREAPRDVVVSDETD